MKTTMQECDDCVIETKDLTKVYKMGKVDVHALRGLSMRVTRGEAVAIMGPSGSGKSTLMNMIGCLDRPTSGEYYLDGKNLSHLNDDALADIRNKKIGFIGGGNMTGRSSLTPLGKVTRALAAAFIATSIALTIIAAEKSAGSSVVDRLGVEQPAAPEVPALPEGGDLLPPPASDAAPTAPRAD